MITSFGPFAAQVVAMHDSVEPYPMAPHVSRKVLGLSAATGSWGTSPVESVNVIAGTLVAAATGMAGAVGSGNLDIFALHDREDLQGAVLAMRGAADVFEAMIKAGRQ